MSLERTALLAVLLLGNACVDPEQSFEDFAERKARAGSGGSGGDTDAGPCNIPRAGEADGPVMLVVASSLDEMRPILFGGSITTTEPPREVHFSLQPLDAADRRTRVGSVIEKTYPVTDDGDLVATIERSVIDARANPITPGVPIESEVTLDGDVCKLAEPWASGPVTSANYYCGSLTGKLYAPLDSDFDGTFTLIRLGAGDVFPEPPPINCDGALASPLAP